MMNNRFEQAFSDYLDSRDYDETADCFFGMLRNAFIAGWIAAGGERPTTERIFTVLKKPE